MDADELDSYIHYEIELLDAVRRQHEATHEQIKAMRAGIEEEEDDEHE